MIELPQVPLAPHMMLLLQMLENAEELEAPHMIELPHRSDAPHMIEEPLLDVAPHMIELPPTNCELPHTAGPDHDWLLPQTAEESLTR